MFPQDEYPEEVSTDEDDDMFGSRKRMKRGARPDRGKDEPAPGPKKSSKPGGQFSCWCGSEPAADQPQLLHSWGSGGVEQNLCCFGSVGADAVNSSSDLCGVRVAGPGPVLPELLLSCGFFVFRK